MLTIKGNVFLVLIASLIVSSAAVAGEQEFSISKNVDYRNVQVDLTTNSKNGDVLVVWKQLSWDKQIHLIYSALCKHKGNGKYKVGKARLISNKSEACQDPKVAYSPSNNSYFVVWSEIGDRRNVQGRMINTKGRTIGPVVEPIERIQFKSRECENIVALPGGTNAAAPTAAYIVLWEYRTGGTDQEGMWSALIDASGQLVGSTNHIFDLDPKIQLWGIDADRMLAPGAESVYLIFRHFKQVKDGVHQVYLARMDLTGIINKNIILDEYDSVEYARIAMLSNKLILTSWSQTSGSERNFINQAVKTKMKKSRKPYAALDAEMKTSELVGLESGGACQLINTSNGDFMVRFNTKGKIVGDPTILQLDSQINDDFRAVQIPGTDKIFLAICHIWTGTSQEVVGYVLEVK